MVKFPEFRSLVLKSTSFKVHIALFVVALIYAVTFIIARKVMNVYIHPFGFILMRVSISALLYLLIHSLFVKEKIIDKKDHLKFIICSVFGVGANMLLFFKGLANTVPINGSVLMTCTPIFVVIVAAIYGTEKLTWSKLVGVLIATTGATLLIAGPDLKFSSETAAGDIMVTINAIIYSFYLVYSRPLMSKYNPITVSKWTFLYGSLFVLPFGFMEISEVKWGEIPDQIWFYIAFIIIASSFVTYLLNAWSLRHGSSSLVGSYIYMQPVLTTLLAEMAGEDKMTLEKAGYALLIFAGVFLVNYKLYKKTTV